MQNEIERGNLERSSAGVYLGLIDPVAQGPDRDAQLVGDLWDRAPGCADELDRFTPELPQTASNSQRLGL